MSNEPGGAETELDRPSGATQGHAVRERYARIATGERSDCGRSDPCCKAGDSAQFGSTEHAESLGYPAEANETVAPGANLGLGCGNPIALSDLDRGDTVLDLGSGAGFDCFLAAREVGPNGRVIGVDMTPAMVEKARDNATRNGAEHVEFRLGEIEHLPVADASVDVIISNCVINLSPDKPRVFEEAHRVLRSGGRIAIADVVVTAELPDDLRHDPESVAACVGGAVEIPVLERMITSRGFTEISIEPKDGSAAFIREWDEDRDLSEYLVSAMIEAAKPIQTQSRPSAE